MESARQQGAALRELCESGFEREVFDRLVLLGYRVTPQVSAGAYAIDLGRVHKFRQPIELAMIPALR